MTPDFDNVWFSDSEVYAHDTLWVFKRQSDGLTYHFWNDNQGVRDFIEAYQPVLCGFNFRGYDSYILKAALLDFTPEETKEVNDSIIHGDGDYSKTFALFAGRGWVTLPPIIDLWHDIVPRRGLKELEANMSMSVVESSVPFDIDRPLTAEERDEVLRYCLHDVDATEVLYGVRADYLRSKADLCDIGGIDPLTMMQHTNARIVSEVLRAEKLNIHERFPNECYTIPDNIDRTAIPQVVIDYVQQWNTNNCMAVKPDTCDFMFHGVPTVVGLGGIHAAVPSYQETASDTRVILLQDIGSYYPSLIITNGYMSRAVPDADAYKQFYDMRMAAKTRGDKGTADAAKLVLNTTFGTMKDVYNKLYDPIQGTRVCLSGQLYIIDLIEQMFRAVPDGLQLIQLNTDGWMVSVPKVSEKAVQRAVEVWQERTGFTVDTAQVQKVVQANVNNYVMRTVDGKVKAKGGVVARHAGGDFKSNSATIIDAAVTAYLLDSTPIRDTIYACDDITRFQIVAKAGRTYQKTVHARTVWDTELTSLGIERGGYIDVEMEIQRVNRVYATTDTRHGGVFKLKIEGGVEVGRSKIPLTPEHCFVDNENLWAQCEIGLTSLDREWYVSLAQSKAHDFVTRKKEERELMSEVTEDHNELTPAPEPAPKPRKRNKTTEESAPEVAPIPSFRERLLTLQGKMAEAAKAVQFDKAIPNMNVDYADTQQYKAWLSQRCTELGLIHSLDITKTDFIGEIQQQNNKPVFACIVEGLITIGDAYSAEYETYAASGIGTNLNAGFTVGGAQTNMLRNFILNHFQLDNKGRDGDDIGLSAEEPKTNGYVSADKKAEIKQGIVGAKADDAKFANEMYAKALYDAIIEARAYKPNFGKAMTDEHYNEDGTPKLGTNGKSTMLKTVAVAGMSKAEEIVAEGKAAAAKAAE